MSSKKVSWALFFDKDEEVLALPSWGAPRILIVSQSPLQRWRDSSAFYPALRFRAKVVKMIVRVLAALFPALFLRKGARTNECSSFRFAKFLNGMFPSFKQSAIAYSLFPDYFTSVGIVQENAYADDLKRRGNLTGVIKRWFPFADRLVLIAGAASDPKQKLVAKVLERSGCAAGFVKFGEKPLARQRIETEVEILQALPQGCGPVFQGLEKTEEYVCFSMSAVEGEMLPATLPEASEGKGPLLEISEYLNQLQVSDELFEIDRHPAVVRLREQVATSDISEATFDELLKPLRSQTWPVVIQHGDFTPWNVFRSPSSGRRTLTHGICAIDWEEGTTEGFPHFDLVYYVLQTAYFMHHWSSAQAFAYARKVVCCQLSVGIAVNQSLIIEQAEVLIRLAALDAWLAGECGGLSGHPLQQFRLGIINLKPSG